MRSHFKALAILAAAAPVLAGCATKGFVRQSVAAEQTRSDSRTDSLVAAERMSRMAADSSLTVDVASLHKDLDSMRTEFNTKITALQDGIRFDVPVHFAFDDATIRDQDRPVLDRFAKVAQKYYPGAVITVEGFADPAGSQAYNKKLSTRRADAVKSYLDAQGLQGADLRTIGYGKTRLVVPHASGSQPGAEQNRRVVFVIESKADSTGGGVASLDNTAGGQQQ